MALSDLIKAQERLTEEINRKDADGDYVFSIEYRAKRQAELDEVKLATMKYRIAEDGAINELDAIKIDTSKYSVDETGTVSKVEVVNEAISGDVPSAPVVE